MNSTVPIWNDRKRRRSLHNATMWWANQDLIMEIYNLAQLRTAVTGIPWEVDHIIPIKHPRVCGLHVELNLQVIPRLFNGRKKNKHARRYRWSDFFPSSTLC